MTDNPNPTRAEIMAADPQQLRLLVANYVMELDALVVEPLVMPVFTGDREFLDKGDIFYTNADGVDMRVPDYPADIAAAWPVHKRMLDSYLGYVSALSDVVSYRVGNYVSLLRVLVLFEPIDICRAALIIVLK